MNSKIDSKPVNQPKPYVVAVESATLSQADKFKQAACDLGVENEEEAFKGILRKLAKAKG